MTKGKKIGFSIFTILLLGGAVAVGAAFANAKEKAPTWETALVRRQTVTETIEASGRIVYPTTRNAAFQLSGSLDTLEVAVGDNVARGELLATLKAGPGMLLPEEQLSEEKKEFLRLTSPIAGVVTAVNLYPGEVVNPGQPVVTIQGPDGEFRVKLEVSENDVLQLDEGDKAIIHLEAMDDGAELIGRVLTIAPTAIDAAGVVSYTVLTSLDYVIEDTAGLLGKGVWLLRAGLTAQAEIVTAEAKNAITVPRRAVFSQGEQNYVRVVIDRDLSNEAADPGYDEREVEIGLRDAQGNTVILDGLVVGEEVVVKL